MKWRNLKAALYSLLAMAALLISAYAPGAVFAQRARGSITVSNMTTSAQRVSAPMVSGLRMNLYSLPAEGAAAAQSHRPLPLLVSPKLAQAKLTAARNANAPRGGAPLPAGASSPSEPIGFNGMADSATICSYFGGCQPPDMALATSPHLVLQGVNTSFAVYNHHGGVVKGPINSQNFFRVPNPSPSGCDPAGPFLSDPRAFYDSNDGYFWAAMLQLENGNGIGTSCNFLSKYWIANINTHTGDMCVYSFDMALGTTNFADYTQFGFNGSSIAFSGNMFNQAGTAYEYAESQFADKHTMEQCKAVTPVAFAHLSVASPTGNVLVDTVQPVETQTTPANDPGVEYLVNSFNMNGDPSGNDCLTTACQGNVVWAFDPVASTLVGTVITGGIPAPTYISPPNADEPGCYQCVETIDTRITATPVFSVGGGAGLISFALGTGVNNGGPGAPNVVSGVLWGQIQAGHFPDGVIANLYQSGYLFFASDRAASFGAPMQDMNGNLYMVFDTMSFSLNPSIMLVSRAKSDPLGTIGHAHFIKTSAVPTFNTRWGDYEAASYTGFDSNQVWVASQYSASSGDWATFIARAS